MSRLAAGLALMGLCVIGGTGCWSRAPRTPPSLLLVTIDTLRADRVGAYGSSQGLTPGFDRLAASGWLFERAVSSVPLTLPSHATILSGLDPLHHGVRNNGTYAFPPNRETLATRLKATGYATGAFVAAVVLDRRYGLDRGFDVYDDRIERVAAGRSVLESERPCLNVVGGARAWIQAQAGPFFAWVHLYEPHAPYAPPADLAAAHPGRPYDAEVAAADRCLSQLVAAAQAARPDSLVAAVTSDHGEGLGDHGEATHGLFLYQSTLAVPMVISGTGVPVGKRTKDLARSADLAPTLLAILGARGLVDVDGRNLGAEGGAGEAYAESDYPAGFGWAPLRSWRLGDLKWIDAPAAELYDLARDPHEERNLATARPQDAERLRGVLRMALRSEVRRDEQRLSREVEERLRSLGYVAGGARRTASAGQAMDPKSALPLFRAFERAMESEAGGDLKSSADILYGLVAKDPGNLTFRRSLASALGRSSRLAETIRVLKEGEKSAPQDPTLLHDLAMALAQQGQIEQAIGFDDRALAIDPTFVEALNHVSALHAGRGELVRAREAIERALTLDPNNPQAWSNRGNILRAQGESDEAGRSYERALGLAPGQVEAMNGLGVLAVEKGRLDEAAQRFERVLEADPRFDEARLNLAVVESQRGRRDLAISLATETLGTTRDPALRARAAAFLRDLQAASR
ncbi:MAG: sulfatase-like hydrolase/transferase [Vicinamibacteria bacterium]|nr:sulfatase-like hydrolase/transferase [Vicinamibacteria bacterium]